MGEFLDFIFNGANAVPTALLLFVIIYWIIVILGLLDTEFLDFDLDIDIDGDADLDAGTSGDISWINNVLIFFNLGRIPVMIWLSFVVLPLWIICINVNGLLGISGFLPGMIIFLPTLILCLFIAKFATWPFVGFFQKLEKDTKAKEIIGKVGIVTMSANSSSKGQAEINYAGSFLKFYIKTREKVIVNKGERVLFIKLLDNNGVYLIEPYNEIV